MPEGLPALIHWSGVSLAINRSNAFCVANATTNPHTAHDAPKMAMVLATIHLWLLPPNARADRRDGLARPLRLCNGRDRSIRPVQRAVRQQGLASHAADPRTRVVHEATAAPESLPRFG